MKILVTGAAGFVGSHVLKRLKELGQDVYGIDNFVGDDFVGTDENRLKYNFVTMKRKKLHLQDNLTLIEGDFNEVAETWNKKIDILHIDGNHNEMNVSRDILLYLPLIKKNGYIIMDDTNWDSIKKSINKFLIPNCELVQDFGYFSCYKKIK